MSPLPAARCPFDGHVTDADGQPDSAAAHAVIMEALKTLLVLAKKLTAGLVFHSDPAFKPPVAHLPRSAAMDDLHKLRYPKRGDGAASLPSSTGVNSLSFSGAIFLMIEALLPLAMAPDASGGRLAARTLVIVRTLLPYLAEPSADRPARDLTRARVLRLLGVAAEGVVGAGPAGGSAPLLLLALDLLHTLHPDEVTPAGVPQPLTAVAGRLLLYESVCGGEGPGGGPWRGWLRPYVEVLDPAVLAVLKAARGTLDRAQAVLPLLEGPGGREEQQAELVDRAHRLLTRLREALVLLTLVPDEGLVSMGVYLWVVAVLGPAAFLSRFADEQERAAAAEWDDVRSLAAQVLIELLSLPLVENRRQAFRWFAAAVAHSDVEGIGSEQAPVSFPPEPAGTLLTTPDHRPAPLTSTLRRVLLRRGLLGGPAGWGREVLYLVLGHGIRSADAETSSAAWDVLCSLCLDLLPDDQELGSSVTVSSFAAPEGSELRRLIFTIARVRRNSPRCCRSLRLPRSGRARRKRPQWLRARLFPT
jgi:hypothetical protein